MTAFSRQAFAATVLRSERIRAPLEATRQLELCMRLRLCCGKPLLLPTVCSIAVIKASLRCRCAARLSARERRPKRRADASCACDRSPMAADLRRCRAPRERHLEAIMNGAFDRRIGNPCCC